MTTGNSDGSSAQGSNFATSVIQVTNIAPQATRDQMYTFFSFVGQVDDVRLYPSMRDASVSITSRTCFVRFADPASVTITLHLNNTVFIDRAIIITPVLGNNVPEENEGLVMAMQIQQQQQQGGVGMSGNGVLGGARGTNNDARILAANPGLISMQPSGKIATPDVALEEAGLPPYPLLPETTPVVRVEEIRRTITVAGLDTTVSAQQCMEFFAENAGEVKYFRYCTREHDHTKYALIEFSERASVVSALHLNDRQLGTAMIKVIHSTESINKPQAKSNEAAVKEIEEAMSKVTEASHLVSAAVDPLMGMLGSAVSAGVGMSGAGLTGSGRSSMARSRSRSRRRSRSRDRDYRSRHRSRSRSRRRSKSRDRGSRRDRRRSRSRSRDRKRSSRHRSRSKESRRERKRSRSREKKRSKRSRSRDRDKEGRSSENGTESISDQNGEGNAVKKDTDHEAVDGGETETRVGIKRGSRSKSPTRRKRSKSRDKGERRKKSRSRSKERRSHRRSSRSKSRERRRRSRSKEKSSSKKSSRHRSRSRDRDRRERKRSRSKDGDRDARGGRSMRERTPDHKVDARVIRDYDQEEAGFDSSGDIKDLDHNNYNGKSRDNRLTTVHEDTRGEAMGTEDMEISNSP